MIQSLTAAGCRVGCYKPAASGCRRVGGQLVCDDAVALWQSAGRPGTLEDVCPQVFEAPLAPHLAARAEGRQVDAGRLRTGIALLANWADLVVVEGSGGLMSPVSDEDYVADLAHEFGYPLVIVAPNVLGVINQTLQTLIAAAAFRGGLDVAGIVLNDVDRSLKDPSSASNRDELVRRARVPLLAHVAWGSKSFESDVDWLALAQSSRHAPRVERTSRGA